VEYRERKIELPHVGKIRHRESSTEIGHQPPRQILEQRLSISRAASTTLLVLDDQAPDVPVRSDHRRVHGSMRSRPRLLQDGADLLVERRCGARRRGRHLPLRHRIPFVSNVEHPRLAPLSLYEEHRGKSAAVASAR
jgi:hypothetical protein